MRCHGQQTSADLCRNSRKTGSGPGRTAGHAGRPAEATPGSYLLCLKRHVFYSAIDRKPKRVAPKRLARLKNIKKTPQVALLVDQYDEDWTRLWYVLVRGEAELVSASSGTQARSSVFESEVSAVSSRKCSRTMLLFCASLLCASPRGARSRSAKSLFNSQSSFLAVGPAETASNRATALREQRPDQRRLRELQFWRRP